jgi:hypothetical protein
VQQSGHTAVGLPQTDGKLRQAFSGLAKTAVWLSQTDGRLRQACSSLAKTAGCLARSVFFSIFADLRGSDASTVWME